MAKDERVKAQQAVSGSNLNIDAVITFAERWGAERAVELVDHMKKVFGETPQWLNRTRRQEMFRKEASKRI